MGKIACEENFAYHDWVKKNKETESILLIGKREPKIKKSAVVC